MNDFIKKNVNILRDILEKIFWTFIGIYTLYQTILFILGQVKYDTFNDFLAQEIFYSIVGFEVLIMALIRVAGESNMMIVYRIHIVVILGIGREMFLKHEINWGIATSLLLTMLSLSIIYVITHKNDVIRFLKDLREWLKIKTSNQKWLEVFYCSIHIVKTQL